MHPRPRLLPNLRPWLFYVFVGTALAARADIAVLCEKGPHSGSAFSNPGLVADAPAGLKVAMKNADVKIHLRPGEGDTLKADCTAEFEMEDSSPAELDGQLYLVGFPVTGLSSKIVTIDHFTVKVDGKEPATVLRQAITISRWQAKLMDQKLSGELAAEFAPDTRKNSWSIGYPAADNYRASYVWQQAIHPSTATFVRVTYTVTLRPQSIHYSKSYDEEESDLEVIPFKSLNVEKWDDQYYFFDYVLRSGATWDGPIGKEVVEVTSAPELALNAYRLNVMNREPPTFGLPEGTEEEEAPRSTGTRGTGSQDTDPKKRSLRWTLENGDPNEDLLISIPVSAIKR